MKPRTVTSVIMDGGPSGLTTTLYLSCNDDLGRGGQLAMFGIREMVAVRDALDGRIRQAEAMGHPIQSDDDGGR